MHFKAAMKRIFLILLLIMMTATGTAIGQELGMPAPSAWPSLTDNIKITGPIDFCNEPVPLDSREVRERLEKEMLLTIWDRPQVVLWIKRTTRYLPIIEQMLGEHDFAPFGTAPKEGGATIRKVITAE